MRVYLAMAIDKSPSSAAHTESIITAIKDGWSSSHPLVMFIPSKAFFTSFIDANYRDDSFIIDINEQALHQSDAMLLVYESGVESWGVPQELLMAYRWEIPVFVLSSVQKSNMPIYLRNRLGSSKIFTDINDLLDSMADVVPHDNQYPL